MNPRDPRRKLKAAMLLLAFGLPPMLRRMRSDFARDGAFRPQTAAAMWSAYGLGTVAYLEALQLGSRPRRDAVGIAALVGGSVGAGLLIAGMRVFQDPGQVTGTHAGDRVTDGVYRYSRNPQYTGLVLLAAAGAAAARSAPAAGLAAAVAATYRYWVPVEETALRQSFGKEYRRYEETTPRWMSLPPVGRR